MKSLSNDKQLEVYSLFKQATVGDVNIPRPGMMDQKGRAKWDAWDGRKGMSKEDAEKAYAELIWEILGYPWSLKNRSWSRAIEDAVYWSLFMRIETDSIEILRNHFDQLGYMHNSIKHSLIK